MCRVVPGRTNMISCAGRQQTRGYATICCQRSLVAHMPNGRIYAPPPGAGALNDVMVLPGPDSTRKPRGVWITVKDPQPPAAAGVLQHAFAAAGISVRVELDPTLPDANEVRLTISSK